MAEADKEERKHAGDPRSDQRRHQTPEDKRHESGGQSEDRCRRNDFSGSEIERRSVEPNLEEVDQRVPARARGGPQATRPAAAAEIHGSTVRENGECTDPTTKIPAAHVRGYPQPEQQREHGRHAENDDQRWAGSDHAPISLGSA